MNILIEILTEVWMWNKNTAMMLLVAAGLGFFLEIVVTLASIITNKLEKK